MKPALVYYGGKQNMLTYILPRVPKHKCYVEPFCGGATVFFAKNKCANEVLNDTNDNLINFYKMLKHKDLYILDQNIIILCSYLKMGDT